MVDRNVVVVAAQILSVSFMPYCRNHNEATGLACNREQVLILEVNI